MTHNEEHIVIFINEYEKRKAEFPNKLVSDHATHFSSKFFIITKKDNNGVCLVCEHEPCLCHLTALDI